MAAQLNWLVTGCSSGTGESLVHAIPAAVISTLPISGIFYVPPKLISRLQGDQVIATARAREKSGLERLAHLKEEGAALMELDVTAPEETILAKAKEAWYGPYMDMWMSWSIMPGTSKSASLKKPSEQETHPSQSRLQSDNRMQRGALDRLPAQ